VNFTLTVPGTDTVLTERDGQLVAAAHAFDEASQGIWDLTRPERRPALDRFAADYAAVRSAESREMTPDEVQSLPSVRPGHPLAAMWHERAASYARFRTELGSLAAGDMVDIGAGCGWLAANLTRDEWRAAAVDVTVHGGDGLAAAKFHRLNILLARAEMEALPFASQSVDLAVLNASLHYATNVVDALHEATRIVRPGGHIAVLDSPVFADPSAGAQMVAEFANQAECSLGVAAATHEGPGFVTEADLDGFDFTWVDDTGKLRQRVHQWRGARRAGRETARRPLLLATIGDTQ